MTKAEMAARFLNQDI